MNQGLIAVSPAQQPARACQRPWVRACRRLAVTLFLAWPMLTRAGDSGAAFDSANKLYEQGKFADAATEYGRIIQSGLASAPLYFNLGNAFFKAGQIGRAILAYRHAKTLTVRDPDVLANLQFARNQVQGSTLSSGLAARWLGKLSLNEWTLLSTGLVWCWLLLLALPQWRPGLKPGLRNWTIALGITAAFVCVCLGMQFAQLRFWPTAVIVTPDAPLHQAPLSESPSPITLHDGAEVRVLDRKDNWLQVSADSRRIGWVQRDQAVPAP
ncbi:MAG TPA: hypothetical protein VJA21_15465 [Verrucomicrobiae bacterium]